MLENETVAQNQNDTKKMLYILDFIMVNATFVSWVYQDPLAIIFTIASVVIIIFTILYIRKNKLGMVE